MQTAVKGKTIKSVEVKAPKLIRPMAVKDFQKQLRGRKILGVARRAKVLLLPLSGKKFLAVHLKLTGQLIYKSKVQNPKFKIRTGGEVNKFTRIIFYFTDGAKLDFNDLRKFGWMKILDEAGVAKISKEFGIEPLTKDFTLVNFKSAVNKYPNRKIKQILLDQKLIAGIGNIYADESCFCAGVLPTRPAGKISEAEMKKLYVCVKKVLKSALAKKGTSADTYLQLSGRPGGFLPYLKVYGRGGENCKRCGSKIQKIKLNGRGTHFCGKCQD